MKEFNINVHVQVGVTDALYSLLSAFTKNVAAPAVQQPAAAVETQAEEVPAEAPAANEEKAPVEEPTAPAVEAKELTEVDVRAAMDRTRRRIEGENYKEDTDGEGYKRYHRQLTAQFKQIASLLGADKPSALPADKRAAFISQCDELEVNKEGNVEPKLPF